VIRRATKTEEEIAARRYGLEACPREAVVACATTIVAAAASTHKRNGAKSSTARFSDERSTRKRDN
jgi:hypothetical protein